MRYRWMIPAALMALVTAPPAWAVDAAAVYAAKCSACHGPKGEGTPVGPAQKGNKFVTAGSAEDIKKVILEGRTAANKKYPNIMTEMPAGLVSAAEAEALVKYLKGDLQK